MKEKEERNNATITGTIITEPQYNDYTQMYKTYVEIERRNGVVDTIRVSIPEDIQSKENLKKGDAVKISGKLKTYSELKEDNKPHLVIDIEARELEKVEELSVPNTNLIEISCTLVSKRGIRLTALSGKMIRDIIVQVSNNEDNRSYYIPAIVWEKCAEEFENYEIGAEFMLVGMLQSREYQKILKDITEAWDKTKVTKIRHSNYLLEKRTAEELCVRRIV